MAAPRRPSDQVAEALRRDPPELDDLHKARLERRLLDAARAGTPAGASASRDDGIDRARRRAGYRGAAIGVLAGAAAAAAAFMLLAGDPETSAPVVRWERVTSGEPVATGALREGDVVATATTQRIAVRLGESAVRLAPGSRARFESLAVEDVRIRLDEGAVVVAYHPERRGEERMTIETISARVEVVGTVFRVAVGDAGATTVRVDEGTVRVVPREGSAQLVGAGDRVTIAAPVATASAEPAARSADEEERGVSAPAPSEAVRAARGLGASAPIAEEATIAAAPAGAAQPETATTGDAPAPVRPLAPDVRFELVETLITRGDTRGALHELRAIARDAERRRDRARAWHRIGDIHRGLAEDLLAAEAFRRAAEVGRNLPEGHNALFDLAMLRERRLRDREGARAAYLQYLEVASFGPLAPEARRALCRLGDTSACTR